MPPFLLSKVPTGPGCYLYKDGAGEIIYIGKAKSLRKRVSQYFQRSFDDKTAELVKRIVDVEFFVTRTESEALLLEANLIRKHKPKYNVDLKGGFRYAYICITDERFPRIMTARRADGRGEYFGPFTNARLRHTLIRTLRKTFFIRTCRRLPKRACLRYHIGLCKAPCTGEQSVVEYAAQVAAAREFLRGDDAVIASLERRMKVLSDEERFEEALLVRDQVAGLRYLREQQLIESSQEYVEDVIHYVRKGKNVEVLVFSVRQGVLGDRQEFSVPLHDGFFDEFLRRFYEEKAPPKTVIVPFEVDPSTQEYLSGLAGRKVEVVVPKRGRRKDLLDLVRENIVAIKEGPSRAAEELMVKLGLSHPPQVIECFDISHLQGSDMVASMVRFVDGKPNKSGYRRFRIRSVEGIDDFRAMHEVVSRRYRRLVAEGSNLPDLVVIDGGAEQLRFALRALDEAGVELPCIGLAKKFEEIYLPGVRVPKRFEKSSEMMRLLIRVRDEAHRFAVSYHRLLRSKRASGSTGRP